MRGLKWLFVSLAALTFVISLTNPAPAFFGSKFEEEYQKEKEAVKLCDDTERGNYRLIDADELKRWIDNGKEMVIIDTMPFEDSYKKAHVPGAVQFLFPIPLMETWDTMETGGKTQEDFADLLGVDKGKPVVVYCGFVKCTRSHNGAAWAAKLGYKNVYRFPGGIFAWKGAGYPTEEVK